MNNLNRRELCIALSALAAVGTLSQDGEAQARSNDVLSQSETWTFDSLPVKHNSNGGASRAVVQGVLATGEAVEVHETTLPAGQMPHPAHKHRHSEFMFIREGDLEFDNDGKKERVGPGGV
ncbi:MAG TPA: cupin domain-containing protein, partial [Edaphobacter sp.]|nr:cupin domain-containing protein [Edaphobacter sp.]